MTIGQQERLYAFGGLVVVSLLLIATPAWVELLGFGLALWICLWVSPFRDTLLVWRETRRLDDEHERL